MKFAVDDRVRIISHNILGTIIGINYEWYKDQIYYIIFLDIPVRGQKGFYILEDQLEKI